MWLTFSSSFEVNQTLQTLPKFSLLVRMGESLPPPAKNLCYNALKTSFLAIVITIFILTSYSLYTQVKPILILSNVQYLQNIAFVLEKGSNSQNNSSSGFHHHKIKFPKQNFPSSSTKGDSPPPPSPLDLIWKTLVRGMQGPELSHGSSAIHAI